jgi:hypothetical protein
MTSDDLRGTSDRRRKLWEALLIRGGIGGCDYPLLGRAAVRSSLVY